MSDPKFYRTTMTIEILGRDEPFVGDIVDVHDATYDGPFSGFVTSTVVEEIPAPEMARALIAQGSDPGFLGLDEDGTDTND